MSTKIAFVTGASRGIGAAIAEQLAKEGYHLAMCSRTEEVLKQKAKEISEKYHVTCMAFSGDVGEENFVREAFGQVEKELGQVEILVNNAGISHIGLMTDMTLEKWDEIIRTNLTSVFLCSKYASLQMLKKKSGKIINISSVWGNVGASCEVAYSASKGGINAFTKALGKELAPSNIQVNGIACGAIDTDMNKCFSQEERTALEEEIPSGRYGTPQEVAKLVSAVIKTPEYLTGQIITMDGGWV